MRILLALCAWMLLGVGCRTSNTAFDQRLCFLINEDPDGTMLIIDPIATPPTLTVTDPTGNDPQINAGTFDGTTFTYSDIIQGNATGTTTIAFHGAHWTMSGETITGFGELIDGITATKSSCQR